MPTRWRSTPNGCWPETSSPALLAYRVSDRPAWLKPALVAGFHRYDAYLLAEIGEAEVEVREGTFADAWLAGYQSNLKNALRYTPTQKKHAIERALVLFPNDSVRSLSDQLKVSKSYVSAVRKSLIDSGAMQAPTEIKAKDGGSFKVKSEEVSTVDSSYDAGPSVDLARERVQGSLFESSPELVSSDDKDSDAGLSVPAEPGSPSRHPSVPASLDFLYTDRRARFAIRFDQRQHVHLVPATTPGEWHIAVIDLVKGEKLTSKEAAYPLWVVTQIPLLCGESVDRLKIGEPPEPAKAWSDRTYTWEGFDWDELEWHIDDEHGPSELNPFFPRPRRWHQDIAWNDEIPANLSFLLASRQAWCGTRDDDDNTRIYLIPAPEEKWFLAAVDTYMGSVGGYEAALSAVEVKHHLPSACCLGEYGFRNFEIFKFQPTPDFGPAATNPFCFHRPSTDQMILCGALALEGGFWCTTDDDRQPVLFFDPDGKLVQRTKALMRAWETAREEDECEV